MSLVLIPYDGPSYTALSSDIVSSKISGASMVGALVYLTDTKTWKVILPNLTLADYTPA